MTLSEIIIFTIMLCLLPARTAFSQVDHSGGETSGGGKTAHVKFSIHVPEATPDDATIFIAGNFHHERAWKANGVRLERNENGEYQGKLELVRGTRFEFKITRGSWATVEKDSAGGEISNRVLEVETNEVVSITVEGWADQVRSDAGKGKHSAAKSTLTGTIKHLPQVVSKFLDRDRDVLVYLPPDYGSNPDRRYPVLYMHDGENVFDASTSFLGVEWGADETAERLIGEGKMEPIIIVAISNTDLRMDEYTPTRDAHFGAGGRGGDYGRFMVEELKPFIDGTYRTLPDKGHTGVAGSSLGGLISLYLAWTYPDTFSRCGVISPSLFWDDRNLMHMIKTGGAERLRGIRFWIDIGTAEGESKDQRDRVAEDVRALAEILKSRGLVAEKNYHLEIVEGAEHNERAWAARLDRVLLYFYGGR